MGFEPTTTSSQSIYNIPKKQLIEHSNNKDLLRDFEDFCRIDLQRANRTVNQHLREIKRFFRVVRKDPRMVSRDDIRCYLTRFNSKSKFTYANVLKSLKVFFRDFMEIELVVKTFEWPSMPERVIIVPTKEQLQRFYSALDNLRDKAMFLLFATTGLRRSEVLSLLIEDIDFNTRMIIPRKRDSNTTKRTWISFFNKEAEKVLREYLASIKDDDLRLFSLHHRSKLRIWKKAREDSGIHITPQVLREWFASEMGRLGVPDRYIDAFQGRIPKSVLARHYTDYSPEKLKEIYERAGLKVLS